MLELWSLILGRPVHLYIMEDNQATILVIRKGYSQKLRHIQRTHKINLGSIKEEIDKDDVTLGYIFTEFQSADIFTKELEPMKWQNAMDLLGIDTKKVLKPSDLATALAEGIVRRLEGDVDGLMEDYHDALFGLGEPRTFVVHERTWHGMFRGVNAEGQGRFEWSSQRESETLPPSEWLSSSEVQWCW